MTQRLLILSFSPIAQDARVLKQVVRFRHEYEVTTVGYGPAPDGVHRHVEIPRSARYDDLSGRMVTLRAYHLVYWRTGAVRWVREFIARGESDVILANDVEAVPVALWLKPKKGVHADLHEFTPLLHADNEAWHRRITPYFSWLVRRYVTHAASVTTVSGGLVRQYRSEFSIDADLVTNAAPFAMLEPVKTHTPIRLVHSGAALRNRRIHDLIDVVRQLAGIATLDLYLTPNHPDYLDEIREQADLVPGVELHDPVPYAELIPTLNEYDLGVHLLPPINFNNTWALPNKLFDYVQARLGILIGPSPEMSEYVRQYSLGVVAESFDPKALAAAVRSLNREQIDEFKASAHLNARELSSESQVEVWAEAVERLASA